MITRLMTRITTHENSNNITQENSTGYIHPFLNSFLISAIFNASKDLDSHLFLHLNYGDLWHCSKVHICYLLCLLFWWRCFY